MDLESLLNFAGDVLREPQRSKFCSLLHDVGAANFPLVVDGQSIIAGEVISYGVFPFVVGQGFVDVSNQQDRVTVSFPDLGKKSMTIREGLQIMCSGLATSVENKKFIFDLTASLHYRPEFDFSWDVTHFQVPFVGGVMLFSGSPRPHWASHWDGR